MVFYFHWHNFLKFLDVEVELHYACNGELPFATIVWAKGITPCDLIIS